MVWGNGADEESAVMTMWNMTVSPTCGEGGLNETERTDQSVEMDAEPTTENSISPVCAAPAPGGCTVTAAK